jgi:hypothetical protein
MLSFCHLISGNKKVQPQFRLTSTKPKREEKKKLRKEQEYKKIKKEKSPDKKVGRKERETNKNYKIIIFLWIICYINYNETELCCQAANLGLLEMETIYQKPPTVSLELFSAIQRNENLLLY